MKLAAVYFDDTVCIPSGKDVGGGVSRQDLRESTFSAADGWELRRVEKGVYSLWREGMERPKFVEGYGSTFDVEPSVNTEQASWVEYGMPRKGTVTVTSIDGDGANTVTLTDPSQARAFVPASPEQHEAMGLRPKRRRK